MIFRQLIDARSWTYTYLLADEESKEAILIDPVFEQVRRDTALLHEMGLTLKYTVDTHVHADHVTGSWLLRDKLGSKIVLMKDSGATGPDLELSDGDTIYFGERHLKALSTPGHTSGCGSFVLDNEHMAFTGDCLMIRGCGRTDFQQGDSRSMYQSIHQKIFSLPDSCSIFPGHDYKGRLMTSVKEEKEFNPRCGGSRSEDDFVGLMDNLGLPHPAQLSVALPANLKCGEPTDGRKMPKDPDWAPLRYNFAGIWQVDSLWLMENETKVEIVDVRPAEEIATTQGTIASAKLVSLDNVVADVQALNLTKPVVVLCRSGGRSALATLKLMKAGFERIANLDGGVLRWSADGGELVSKV